MGLVVVAAATVSISYKKIHQAKKCELSDNKANEHFLTPNYPNHFIWRSN